ncbi:bifunctional demethylmenaquinone methyltransferase/2-methoxy-6-polyprenyl-1,4-benzoquinol methylase UbiE [Polyangium spumosum]|uniref:Demethylmenaquinone methyltransferase n=1 Tax=Polyangium spumosum TaxID=889282 RepID=A0A6N7PX00_9BACT|nr:bifunctional demethylmenaquinone methyltransferase/2-methoxy-6-polyprenyl-1,4-benzoquinol methylase UbiE [Polyangium spumosum]MRG96047.1 bifunctional demethylmenaquinone methyltransferase/2-methoxy-6-polyprenyl-1,4-benzoquinol methylase UbiE [Polyangium spumosum]
MSHEATKAPRAGSGEMFDAIAARYDILNRILSLGMDQGWRRRAVQALALRRSARALDLATGTADLAMTIARWYPDATVIGLDPSSGMLAEGAHKLAAAGLEDRVTLRIGDAQALPFEDASVDGVAIAFGIRNVPDRARALREMARVTRPGGRVVILELSEPRAGLMGLLARTYVHEIVPRIGAALSGAKEYRYLQRSIEAFPSPEVFTRMMGEAGLSVVEASPLTFGVAHLFVGTPLEERARREEA